MTEIKSMIDVAHSIETEYQNNSWAKDQKSPRWGGNYQERGSGKQYEKINKITPTYQRTIGWDQE